MILMTQNSVYESVPNTIICPCIKILVTVFQRVKKKQLRLKT